MTKKLKELEFYGYDVINKTIEKTYNSIQYAIQHKEFINDVGKISYIFGIIKNNINDVYKQTVQQEREKKNETVCEIDNEVDIDNIQTKHKEKILRNGWRMTIGFK